jgi:IS30 family transposase
MNASAHWNRMVRVVMPPARVRVRVRRGRATNVKPQELVEIRELYIANRITLTEIGKRFGRTASAIAKYVERNGWARHRAAPAPKPEPVKTEPRFLVTEDIRARVIEALRAGNTQAKISTDLGVSVSTVSQIGVRSGLRRNRRQA